MKVILLQDVAKIGRRYEEVSVPDGYALNMLIPKGMAEVATSLNRKKVAAHRGVQAASLSASEDSLMEAVEKIKENALSVEVEANDKDHFFQSLKIESIVDAAARDGILLKAEQIVISDPIKSLGEHPIILKAGSKSVEVKINVVKV